MKTKYIFLLFLSLSIVHFPFQTLKADNKFKVGLILPLSGSAADFGVSIQNSVSLAIKDNPEKFSNIDFIYDDVQYETKQAVLSLNSMKDTRNIDIAITWGVPFCKALAPLAERRKIPLIGICIDPESSKGRTYVMLFMNVTYEFMEKQVEYLKHKKFKNLALLVSDNAYLSEMKKAFDSKITKDFFVDYMEGIPSTENDFRTHIIKLKKNSYDAIGVFLSLGGQAASFYKQAQQLGFEQPTFATNFLESYSEIKSARGSMTGAVFANTKINASYRDKYKQEFGNESQLAFGGPAYELALTIGELFNSNNVTITPEQIIEKLHTMPEKEGYASGPYRVINSKEYGTYVQFPITIKEVKDDSYRELRLEDY